MNRSISIVGSGNAAYHFAQALKTSGQNITAIYARNTNAGSSLANAVNSNHKSFEAISEIKNQLVFICTSDQVISEINHKIDDSNFKVHCSGATPLSAINGGKTGVIYPLQTLTKDKAINYKDLPLLIEGNSLEATEELVSIAKKISEHVNVFSTEQRLKLHLAAVFACNFSNYMVSVAQDYLEQENIPFDLLKMLIKETTDKALEIGPSNAQTGPALRNDNTVLTKHKTLLESQPKLAELYHTITSLIQEKHHVI